MKEKNKIITVIVEGGLVQNVLEIPAGITVKVVDYDTEGEKEDSDRIQRVKLGNDEPETAFVSYWRKT